MISLGGLKMCIVTSPSDISAIYKDTENLSFDPFMKEMLSRIGVSSAASEKWIPSPPDPGSNSNSSSSSAAAAAWASGGGHQRQQDDKGATKIKPSVHEISHVGQKLCRQQLLPGKEFDLLSTKLIQDIEQSLQWHNISSVVTVVSSSTSTKTGTGTKRVSLLAWCREVLILSATRSFFSDRLLQIDPHLINSFYTFDAESWKAFFKFPPFLSRKMDAGKDRILDALTRYFSLPKVERKDESWLISNLEAEMIKAGINDVAEIASIVMPLYWAYVIFSPPACTCACTYRGCVVRIGISRSFTKRAISYSYRINANAYRGAFWTLAYVLQDQSLIAALRREISPVFAQGTTTNLGPRIENCALLESVYFESLRLSSSSATIRTVRNTTTIGDFTLRKGIEVLVPYRQLHFDNSVWGPSPAQFNPERFLKNSHLKQSPSFKPFGGGSTYCPGRFLARREVMTFVALVLHRFDVTLSTLPADGPYGGTSKKQKMPRIDHKKLAVSLVSPMAGEDLLLDVRLGNKALE